VIEAIELLRFSLPFVAPIRTSYGEERSREGTLVRVITSDGEGWGECAALARPDYHQEFADGAFAVLRDELAPGVLAGATLPSGNPMARAALELAVLDADLRVAGVSLAHHLAATAMSVRACAVVGVGGALPSAYARVKVKLATVADIDRVVAMRESVGDAVDIAVDANGAFSTRDIDSLRRLADLDVLFIEQPFAEPTRVDLGTPICLDESISSYDDAVRAIDLGLADVISIKAARLGGYPEAKRVHDLCVERGIAAWCGGMYDAGVSKAANLALAGLPGFIGGDLAASDHYFARDITEPFVLDDGYLAVPEGPGIGVTPDAEVLADVVIERVTIS